MALNTRKTWSNGVKTAYLLKKFRKIAQRLTDLRLWYIRLWKVSQTSVCDTFELQYTSLLNTSPNLDIFTF